MMQANQRSTNQAVDECPSLVRLTNEMTHVLESGSHFDLDAFVDLHPEHAEQLRRLYPTIRGMVSFGRVFSEDGHRVTAEEPLSGVLGDFRIIREVGRGGMGVVYEAVQISLNRRVALKILPLAAVLDPRQLQRFKNEAQAAALLHHQNIVPIHGVGSERSVHFYAMQFIEGQTLADVIGDLRRIATPQRDGGVQSSDIAGRITGNSPRSGSRAPSREDASLDHATPSRGVTPDSQTKRDLQAVISTHRSVKSVTYFRNVADVGIQVADALQHAHEHGVVHRDVKPSNLIVDARGKVWVTDFGLARVESDAGVTMTGDMIGTLRYMSPEQALAKRVSVDERTDIYSLGVTLYEHLTLKPAFEGTDRQQLLKQIAFEEPRAPTKLNQAMPHDLETIVLKAMAKNPDERYSTARELAEDLRLFLTDKPIKARRPSSVQRLAKWSKRHQPIVWSIVVASVVLLTFIALASALLAAKQQVIAKQEHARRVAVERARQREAALREKATGLLAGSYVDRAQSLCEQREIGRGMLWLAHALDLASKQRTDLSGAIRTSLAAWHRELHSLAAVLQHPRGVGAVAFTPNGEKIVTGCNDGLARVWDIATGEPVGQAMFHGALINAVAVSPDGSIIATGSGDNTDENTGDDIVRLWDGVTRKAIGGNLRNGSVRARSPLQFSPDGLQLVTGSSDRSVLRWDARSGEFLGTVIKCDQELDEFNVRAIRFCSNGLRVVVTVALGTHQVFDGDTGRPIGPAVVNAPNTFAVAISADGSRFATAGIGGNICVWESATAELAASGMSVGTTWALAFSPDGATLASGGAARAALLWDLVAGEHIGPPMRQRSTVFRLAFSGDGHRLVTANGDGTVHVWDLAPRPSPDLSITRGGPVVSAVFGQEGLQVLTRDDSGLQLRDASTGDPVGKPFPDSGHAGFVLTYSPDASQLLLDDRLFDMNTHAQIGPTLRYPRTAYLSTAVFSPDGSRVLAGFQTRQDGLAQLRDAATLRSIGELRQHQGTVRGVAFSPDGSRLLTGSYDGTTQLWNAATLEPIGEPLRHQSEVKDLAFSPDGKRILIGFADGTIQLWDASTLEPIGTPLQYVNIVCSVAFSPDGSRLLACSIDKTARLWDTATLKPVGPPLRHACSWPEARFSPQGDQILLVDYKKGRVQRWDAPPGPLAGGVDQITCWVESVTGLKLDPATGEIIVLDPPSWQERRQRLKTLGGTPLALSLPAPATKPETEFSRAMARALRGRDRAEAGLWELAEKDFQESLELASDSPVLKAQITCWRDQLTADQSRKGR